MTRESDKQEGLQAAVYGIECVTLLLHLIQLHH